MDIFSFVQNIELLEGTLLVLGFLLLLAEVFIPGFGVAGITGIILFIIGILLTATTVFEALIMFLLLLLLLTIVLIFVIRSATRGRLSKKLILNDGLSNEDGFTAVEDMQVFLGKEGKAVTTLRPAGIGLIDGVRLDIVTKGNFIEEGSNIKVIEVEGRRIIVDIIKDLKEEN